MKKIILILTLVISLILCSVNCFAVGNTISKQEAKDLLLAANNFFANIKDM